MVVDEETCRLGEARGSVHVGSYVRATSTAAMAAALPFLNVVGGAIDGSGLNAVVRHLGDDEEETPSSCSLIAFRRRQCDFRNITHG